LDRKVSIDGDPLQCYVVTEEGVLWRDIRFRGLDPKTGHPCEPAEPELLPALERLDRLLRAGGRLEAFDPQGRFFAATGTPIVWFERTESGEYEFFDAPGFHPSTGRRLQPVSEANVQDWRQHEQEKAAAARRAAEEAARIAQERLRAQAEAARRAEEASKQAEAEKRKQEHQAHMRRLVIAGGRDAAGATLGLVIIPRRPGNPLDRLAASQLPDRIAAAVGPQRQVLREMLAPAFIEEGHFARVYAGDATPLHEAEAFAHARRILLGEVTTSCTANDTVRPALTSCRVTFAFRMLGAEGMVLDAGELIETGPGFSAERAVERGVELMIERSGIRLLRTMEG
jgi:hypothetical protein